MERRLSKKDTKKLGIDSKNKTNYSQTEYYYLRVKNRLYSNDFVKKVEKEFMKWLKKDYKME